MSLEVCGSEIPLWPSDPISRHTCRSWPTLVPLSGFGQEITCCRAAPSHYLVNIDLTSKTPCGIHLRAISHEVLMNLIRIIGDWTFKINATFWKPSLNDRWSVLFYSREWVLLFLPLFIHTHILIISFDNKSIKFSRLVFISRVEI